METKPEPAGAGGAGAGSAAPAGKGRRRGRHKPALSLTHSLSLTHNSTRILDHVFLGGQEACSEKSTMTFLKITHVLNVSCECDNLFPESFQYLRIPVKDAVDEQIKPHFETASNFLDEVKAAGTACLVHCKSGMSRSSAFVLAHMMKSMGMTLRSALIHTKERRPRASPNAGFMAQLVEYEIELRGKATIDVDKYKEHRFDAVDTFELVPDDGESKK